MTNTFKSVALIVVSSIILIFIGVFTYANYKAVTYMKSMVNSVAIYPGTEKVSESARGSIDMLGNARYAENIYKINSNEHFSDILKFYQEDLLHKGWRVLSVSRDMGVRGRNDRGDITVAVNCVTENGKKIPQSESCKEFPGFQMQIEVGYNITNQ